MQTNIYRKLPSFPLDPDETAAKAAEAAAAKLEKDKKGAATESGTDSEDH